MKRRTVKTEFIIEGKGLHRGKDNLLVVKPYGGKGIVFRNPDNGKTVTVDVSNVFSLNRGTVIGDENFSVSTVEHLLSCFFAFEIDDAEIEIRGDEVPAFDGSAKAICEVVKKVGVMEKDDDADVMVVEEPFVFVSGDSFYKVEKSERFGVECVFESSHPLVGIQRFVWEEGIESYCSDIAPARTFVFEEEIEMIKKNNLALGGSLDNAVVIGKDRIINEEGLRFEDEFVRHKILDILGDLKLAGARFRNMKITAKRPSHRANVSLVKLIKARSLYDRKKESTSG